MFGILNINKPPHLTSRDVVNRICDAMGTRKIGHAGTLDPMATGVLVVCVGPATRLVPFVLQSHKTYDAQFRLGAESTTEDLYGTVTELEGAPVINQSQLRDVLPEFVGEIQQVPPAFSALKIDGKRAYKLARRGKEVNLSPRKVKIYGLEQIEFNPPHVLLKISCNSGTYIRSLGRDIARRLGTGAIMTKLARTEVGSFTLENSVSIESVEQDWENHIQSPLSCLNNLPVCVVDDDLIAYIVNGGFIKHDFVAAQTAITRETETIVATDTEGRLIAVFERFDPNNFKPKTNFAHYWLARS